MALEIRRADEDDVESIVALCTESLDWDPSTSNDQFLRWKHFDNPLQPSYILLAYEGPVLVAVRAMMRWEFELDGAVHRAVRAVDTATKPLRQGRGLFRTRTLAAVSDLTAEGVSFVFNTPNSKSKPGYLSMGWHGSHRHPPRGGDHHRHPRTAGRLTSANEAKGHRPTSITPLRYGLLDYLEILHNRRSRHSGIGMLTPIEYENRHTQPHDHTQQPVRENAGEVNLNRRTKPVTIKHLVHAGHHKSASKWLRRRATSSSTRPAVDDGGVSSVLHGISDSDRLSAAAFQVTLDEFRRRAAASLQALAGGPRGQPIMTGLRKVVKPAVGVSQPSSRPNECRFAGRLASGQQLNDMFRGLREQPISTAPDSLRTYDQVASRSAGQCGRHGRRNRTGAHR